jgi:hypothetical protein
MSIDFYQTPLVKNCWVFSSFNNTTNALAPKFWTNIVQCYELILVMRQTNTQFIKTLNKFHTCTQTLKDIQYINSNCCRQIPNILTTPHLFYTNILVRKHNKFVFNNTYGPTFNFEVIDIHHHSCPSSYKLSNDPSKTTSLHTTIHIKQDMVRLLCAKNYATWPC